MLTQAEINSYRRRLLALKNRIGAGSSRAGRGGPATRRGRNPSTCLMCRSIRRPGSRELRGRGRAGAPGKYEHLLMDVNDALAASARDVRCLRRTATKLISEDVWKPCLTPAIASGAPREQLALVIEYDKNSRVETTMAEAQLIRCPPWPEIACRWTRSHQA